MEPEPPKIDGFETGTGVTEPSVPEPWSGLISVEKEDGTATTSEQEVVGEFLDFYRKLSGSRGTTIYGDWDAINAGPKLFEVDQAILMAPVSGKEIKDSL
ncbi:hypothetical protein Dimus_030790 [Dionaea muscipula]